MPIPGLHIRPPRNQLSWHGAPLDTWTVLQRATRVLLARWRPAALILTRTQFDDEGLPSGSGWSDSLEIQGERSALDALVDVSEVLAANPIDARIALPPNPGDATTLWFIDPDQRERQARLVEAPDVGEWRTRWFVADCPLLRGFTLQIPVRGRIDANWDRGIFAGNAEPSAWQGLDRDLDDWVVRQLRDLQFTER